MKFEEMFYVCELELKLNNTLPLPLEVIDILSINDSYSNVSFNIWHKIQSLASKKFLIDDAGISFEKNKQYLIPANFNCDCVIEVKFLSNKENDPIDVILEYKAQFKNGILNNDLQLENYNFSNPKIRKKISKYDQNIDKWYNKYFLNYIKYYLILVPVKFVLFRSNSLYSEIYFFRKP
jgi:hypothetical protein